MQNRGAYPIGNGLTGSDERFARQIAYPGDRVTIHSLERIYFDSGLEAKDSNLPDDIPVEYHQMWKNGFDRQMNEAIEYTKSCGGDLEKNRMQIRLERRTRNNKMRPPSDD